ncbi:hypothetical protein CN918_26645 [Priestia megaterium]|nr:hypothetical protein CN918_26645 [Priestia megaterium]
MQKVSQLVTLCLTILVLVILFLFLLEQPDYNSYAQKEEVQDSVKLIQSTVDEKIKAADKDTDTKKLQEKVTKLTNENKTLSADVKELRTELDELKKKLNKKVPTKPTTTKPTPAKKPEVLKNEKVKVNVNKLNFRKKPSISAHIYKTIKRNTNLEVMNRTVYEKDGHKWVYVKLPTGEVGYVAREYVR